MKNKRLKIQYDLIGRYLLAVINSGYIVDKVENRFILMMMVIQGSIKSNDFMTIVSKIN